MLGKLFVTFKEFSLLDSLLCLENRGVDREGGHVADCALICDTGNIASPVGLA